MNNNILPIYKNTISMRSSAGRHSASRSHSFWGSTKKILSQLYKTMFGNNVPEIIFFANQEQYIMKENVIDHPALQSLESPFSVCETAYLDMSA